MNGFRILTIHGWFDYCLDCGNKYDNSRNSDPKVPWDVEDCEGCDKKDSAAKDIFLGSPPTLWHTRPLPPMPPIREG